MHGQRWPTTYPLPESKRLIRGRLLTADCLIAAPEEKRRLGERYQADAVDMESALFAARCTQAGIPFGCVRAISDEVTTPLSPALVALLSGSTVSPWRVLTALLRQPCLLRELLRLARDTKQAARQLGQALTESLL
jgi:adenosylhomocysteine nucleosidase